MTIKYKHSDWFDNIALPDFDAAEEIFLWGAGKIATVVAHSLLKKGYDFTAFVDIAKDKQGTIFYDHKVISPEELFEKHKNAMVIVSCTFPTVLDDLNKHGMENVWDPHSLLMEVDMDGYKGEMNVEYLNRMIENALSCFASYYGFGGKIKKLYFMITDKCTLRCKNCDGCIPYITNPQNDSYEDIIESYQNIIHVCGPVEQVNLFGGEPLLHPQVKELVQFFVKDNNCKEVAIISNGTISLSDALRQELVNEKVILRISDYGEISRKKEEIISTCKKDGIKYEITNYQYWDRIPRIKKTNETVEQLDIKYGMCTTNYLYVKHKKAFHCVLTAALSSISDAMIPNYEQNYVLLEDGNSEKLESFVKQLLEKRHIDACNYCPGSHCMQWEEKVPVAEQVKEKIPINQLYENGVDLG